MSLFLSETLQIRLNFLLKDNTYTGTTTDVVSAEEAVRVLEAVYNEVLKAAPLPVKVFLGEGGTRCILVGSKSRDDQVFTDKSLSFSEFLLEECSDLTECEFYGGVAGLAVSTSTYPHSLNTMPFRQRIGHLNTLVFQSSSSADRRASKRPFMSANPLIRPTKSTPEQQSRCTMLGSRSLYKILSNDGKSTLSLVSTAAYGTPLLRTVPTNSRTGSDEDIKNSKTASPTYT